MDKPGVGERQGDCSRPDVKSEMEGWGRVQRLGGNMDFMDSERGLRRGAQPRGGFSPLAAQEIAARLRLCRLMEGPALVRA